MEHVATMKLKELRLVTVSTFDGRAAWPEGYYEWRIPTGEVIRCGTSMSVPTINRIKSFEKSITDGLADKPKARTRPCEAKLWKEILCDVGELHAYAYLPQKVRIKGFGMVRPTLAIEVKRIREERARKNRRYPLLSRSWR